MPDEKKVPIPLTFEAGLVEHIEPSRLANAAVVLENWVPQPDGSLRTRIRWEKGSDTDAPADRRARGIGFMPIGEHRFVVANQKDADELELIAIPKGDLEAGAWTSLETVAGLGDTTPFVSMAVGLGHLFYCTDEFATIRRWDGVAAPASIVGSKPGKSLAYWANCLFSAGDPANPFRVWRSDVGDYTAWNTFWDIRKDEGEGIECIAPFDNGLLIGKESSLHYLAGITASSQVVTLDSGGCAPGRTIVPTPYGAVIVGRETVWLFRGGTPEPISRAIENTFGYESGFITATYINDSVHIALEASGTVCVYDLANQKWHVEKYDTPEENGPAVIFSQGDYLLAGPKDSETAPPLIYRRFPGGTRGRDDDAPQVYKLRTPALWLGGTERPSTVMNLYMRIRQRAGNASEAQMTVTPIYDGVEAEAELVKPVSDSPKTFMHRIDLGKTAFQVELEVELSVPTTDDVSFDIEEMVLYADIEKRK